MLNSNICHAIHGHTADYCCAANLRFESCAQVSADLCRQVQAMVRCPPDHSPAVQAQGVDVQLALQWCHSTYSDTLVGFVNSIKTIDGGTHMEGLKSSLTRTLNSIGRKTKALKDEHPNLSGDFIREGLTAIVSVKVGCSTIYIG